MMEMSYNDKEAWYALRVTYQRELIAKSILNEQNIISYVPTKKIAKVVRGRIASVVVPVIHNYIFIYSSINKIQELKNYKMPYLRYVMVKNDEGQMKPLEVPDYQMKNFMLIASVDDPETEFYTPVIEDLKKGDRVRVLEGEFKGLEGTYIRMKKERKKRVVVHISTIIGIATRTLPPELVEKI